MHPVCDYEFCKPRILNTASIIFVKAFIHMYSKNNLITCHGWLQRCFCKCCDKKNTRKNKTQEVHFYTLKKIFFIILILRQNAIYISYETNNFLQNYASIQPYQSIVKDISIWSLSYLIITNRIFFKYHKEFVGD